MRSVLIQNPSQGLFKNPFESYKAKNITPDIEKIRMVIEKTIAQKKIELPSKFNAQDYETATIMLYLAISHRHSNLPRRNF